MNLSTGIKIIVSFLTILLISIPLTTPSSAAPEPGTKLTLTVLLHGIGIAGDTTSPITDSLSNKEPNTPNRDVKIFVFNANNEQIATGAGTISYVKPGDFLGDKEVGMFKGFVKLDTTLKNGQYTILLSSDRYLRKAFATPLFISGNTENVLPRITLVAGDTDGNNSLDIADYNAMRDCGFGSLNPLPLTNQKAEYGSDACRGHEPRSNVDLNDDGIVNALDYNLFVRELSVQHGD